MSEAAVKQGSERQSAPQFGEAEERELRRLFGQWREGAGLGAHEENQFAHLLKALVASRAAELLESDAFILLMRSFAGEAEFSADERQDLVRQVKPLLRVRVLTEQEKKELAQLFDRYHMRLWSKLRRAIGATLEAKFEPSDVLQEAYIRAMTRWSARPGDPEKQYVWLYGIVHEQFCDMLRRVKAVKRGDRREHVRIPDNSAAEIALQFWQSQTGVSTIAGRKEFVARLQGFLERILSPTDLEIFSMRVFDRLEYSEIATVLHYRSEESNPVADYQTILAEADSRSQDGDGTGEDADKRPADAIRKRFKRAVAKLTGAILAEFPELLDVLPGLEPGKA